MSSTQEKPLDLTALADQYDIVGEYAALGQSRRYPGRRKQDNRDVLITVLHGAPDVAQGKAIAQFAADANLMTTLSHPNVPQVLEGRWIGDDAFALITDRVHGPTLAELLRSERIPNPRVADILADVDGVLEWARNERISHRGVTPDGIWIERGTGKVYVSPAPMDAPKTNRPDPRDDARTIGQLALAMLTAKPMGDEHDGTLLSMRPDLPQRVVTATEKVAATTINDEAPDISAYLASLAMADAIKEGELEVARVEAEFRAQMKAEREKWEAEQHACQLANEAQAKKFAEERAEYERRSTKEREQLAVARGEIDKRRAEIQQARAELDQARAEFKQRKADLEARAKQLDKRVADMEKQSRALEKRAEELERRNLELQQLATLAAAGQATAAEDATSPTSVEGLRDRIQHAGEVNRPTQPIPVVDDAALEEPAPEDDVEVLEEAIVAEEAVQGWTPIETEEPWAVPLETDEPVSALQYEAAAVPAEEPRRRSWALAAGIAGLVLIVLGTAFGLTRHGGDNTPPAVQKVAVAPASAPQTASPTPALAVDSAAGSIAPSSDSIAFAALRDSIASADEARRARQARAASEAEAPKPKPRTYVDSTGKTWYIEPPKTDRPPETTSAQTPPAQPPSTQAAPPLAASNVALPPAQAIGAKPDSVRHDTTAKPKPKPDTLTCCHM